ncbi:MAG: hypothetical protein ACOXZR_01830 [Bacilli bacterium]
MNIIEEQKENIKGILHGFDRMLNKKVSSRLLLKWEFNILYDYFSIITIKFELKLLL